MKTPLLLIIVVALGTLGSGVAVSAAPPELQKPGVLHVATEGQFKPFNFMEGEKPAGFEVELAGAVARKMGLKIEWTVQPFDSLLIGLNDGRYDLVAASHAITPERSKAVDFTDPHYCSGGVIVSKKGGPLTDKDLAGKVVAVPTGTTYYEHLKANTSIKELKTLPTDNDGYLNLVAGRVDAWLADRLFAEQFLKAHPDDGLQMGGIIFLEKDAMAVAKGNLALKKRVDAALASVVKDGTYLKLSKKFFGEDISCKAVGHTR